MPQAIPRRAIMLTAKIEADSTADLVDHLLEVVRELERGELRTGVRGGAQSSHMLELVQNAEPTHDQYFAQIRDYLAHRVTT